MAKCSNIRLKKLIAELKYYNVFDAFLVFIAMLCIININMRSMKALSLIL